MICINDKYIDENEIVFISNIFNEYRCIYFYIFLKNNNQKIDIFYNTEYQYIQNELYEKINIIRNNLINSCNKKIVKIDNVINLSKNINKYIKTYE